MLLRPRSRPPALFRPLTTIHTRLRTLPPSTTHATAAFPALSPRHQLPFPRCFHHSPLTSAIKPTTYSYVTGPTTTPLIDIPLGTFWSNTVAAYPSSLALISRHEHPDQHLPTYTGGHKAGEGEGKCLKWTYEEMDRHVDALARGLLKLGVKKGDRVGVFLGNGSTYATLQWATAKLGAVLVCINPASKGGELLPALNLTGCHTLFISPTIRKNDLIPMLHTLFPSLRSTPASQELEEPDCPGLKRVVMVDNTTLGAKSFEKKLEEEGLGGRDLRNVFEWKGEGVPGAEECSPDDIINFQFTSGTTGLPKAVALTHHNVLNNGLLIGDCMNLRPPSLAENWSGERLANSPPAFHCFGLVLGNLAVWTHGGCIVYPSELFDAALTLRAIHQEKCTGNHGVPTMFIAQLALLEAMERGEKVPNLSDLGKELDLSSLRTGIAAGSPVPDEVMRRLVSRMNLRDVCITYGQTETSPASTMSRTSDPLPLRCTTVGQVLPHTHVRIVDPLHEAYPDPDMPSVEVGQAGELWSGGYAVFKGYWGNEEETNKCSFVDREGVKWMRTGDQATMDEEGYVRIVGRIKDLIIRGGENLFPVVIEARTLLLPGIEDCSTIAVPDALMGEVVGVFLTRSRSTNAPVVTAVEVQEHIRNLLGHQSVPEWVWWLGEGGVPNEYPKTASGKIRKVDLRDWAKDLVERGVGKMRKS